MPQSGLINKKTNVISAKDIVLSAGISVDGFDFLGSLPEVFLMLVHGRAGGGKSTFAIKFLNEIAKLQSNRVCLYWSSEEGAKETIAQKLTLLEIKTENLFFSLARNKDEFCSEIKKFSPCVVAIDSIQHACLSVDDLLSIYDLAKCKTVFICQETKDGKHKGDSGFSFITDINVIVEEGKARTEKNRFAPLSEIEIFGGGKKC